MDNPTYKSCIDKGGILTNKKDGIGGEYALCDFGDGLSFVEWALFRGESIERD